MPTPAPASSPSRARLEQLLARLATGYVASLKPMERTLALGIIRARGWDLERLASGSGPLAPVSDRALRVLARAFCDELMVAADGLGGYTEADLDAAMAELKGALA